MGIIATTWEKTKEFGASISDGVASAVQFSGSGGTTGKTGGSWKFPLTLEEGQHTSRLVFTATNVLDSDAENADRQKAFGNVKGVKLKDIGTVFLYMPKIQTAYNQNYDESGRGLIWQLVKSAERGDGHIFGSSGANVLKTGTVAAVQTLAPNLVRDFAQNIQNQYNSAHFTGTQLRKQKFDYELRPRNQEELVQVAGIIKFFKAQSATYKATADTLQTPARWIIEEMTSGAQREIPPFRFGPAFLTSVEINMTPDNQWKTFENGDPIAVNLSLEFIELTIVTRNDIEDLNL